MPSVSGKLLPSSLLCLYEVSSIWPPTNWRLGHPNPGLVQNVTFLFCVSLVSSFCCFFVLVAQSYFPTHTPIGSKSTSSRPRSLQCDGSPTPRLALDMIRRCCHRVNHPGQVLCTIIPTDTLRRWIAYTNVMSCH